MTRLLLVKPRTVSKDITLPLGLMYISAAARARVPDLTVELIDLRLAHQELAAFDATLRRVQPTVVGFSFLTVELAGARELLRRVRAHDATVPIIAGGPHASSAPEALLADCPEIDAAVVGEGEETFVEWLAARRAGRGDLADIDGLVWRDPQGRVVRNAPRAPTDVDALPRPDYGLVRLEEYWREESMDLLPRRRRYHRYANLFTSRGCPYGCVYCHDLFGRRFRPRNPEAVVAEMAFLQREHGVEEFEIIDDVFNFNRKRVVAICRAIQSAGLRVRLTFPNGLRGDRLDRELLTLLRDTGTTYLAVAIETASPRLQRRIGKRLDLTKAARAIDDSHELGMFTGGFFMLGFPTETRDELHATVDFALRSKLDRALFFIVLPFAGTPLGAEVAAGSGTMNEDLATVDCHTSRRSLAEVSDAELQRIQRVAELRFLLGPRRLYYLWRQVRSPVVFLHSVAAQTWGHGWHLLGRFPPQLNRLQERLAQRLGLRR